MLRTWKTSGPPVTPPTHRQLHVGISVGLLFSALLPVKFPGVCGGNKKGNKFSWEEKP